MLIIYLYAYQSSVSRRQAIVMTWSPNSVIEPGNLIWYITYEQFHGVIDFSSCQTANILRTMIYT